MEGLAVNIIGINCLFLIGFILLQVISIKAGPNSIPTREEQANLLSNVQEVFEGVKKLVQDEGVATDESVAEDVKRLVFRAEDTLRVAEELSFTKISCNSNKVCALDYKTKIRDIMEDAQAVLKKCSDTASSDIVQSSSRLNEDTISATSRGQDFLDSLRNCSKKSGLGVIGCYKGVIASDVVPVKNMLLRAINDHRDAHKRTIQIRQDASDCIDETMRVYQTRMADVLAEALTCS